MASGPSPYSPLSPSRAADGVPGRLPRRRCLLRAERGLDHRSAGPRL